jgi:acyl-CoA synthetase (AMP-forming)/AMP-acid ligase II
MAAPGDVGVLDGEGHLYVTGRRAQRILTGGTNVDPSEVEAVLRLHDRVEDVAVVGLPDAEWGEVVGAAVVARPGGTLDQSALEALARERLAPAKLPRRFVFLPELPRNANGKVDVAALRAALLDAPQPPR